MSKNKYETISVNGTKYRLHRYLMMQHLKRNLLDEEHVYHVNGDSKDNRIENLVIITKKKK